VTVIAKRQQLATIIILCKVNARSSPANPSRLCRRSRDRQAQATRDCSRTRGSLGKRHRLNGGNRSF
jgi:hypothetical protein